MSLRVRKLSILVYSYAFNPSIGGMENVAEILARYFHEVGCKVTVVTETLSNGSEPFPFPILRRPGHFQFWEACRRHDVILSFPLALKRFATQVMSGRRIVTHHPNAYISRNGKYRFIDRLKRFCCRFTTNVVPSRYMLKEIRAQAIIIPNPYDDSTFSLTVPERNNDIVFVGRLATVKGVDVLLRAVCEMASEVASFRVTVVGDGPERTALERLASDLNIASRVMFVGPLRGNEVAATMRRHGIMVVPSTYREPFGIVALEGLASGCSLIVSRHGGLVDAIGPHGLSFENGNVHELAESLRQMMMDPACRISLRQGVEAHMTRHRVCEVGARYLSLLESNARDFYK